MYEGLGAAPAVAADGPLGDPELLDEGELEQPAKTSAAAARVKAAEACRHRGRGVSVTGLLHLLVKMHGSR
jgi:hypothetical protein